MLAKSKLNCIETLVSKALIDMEISHEEYITILKEKNKYEKMKENVTSISKKLEEKKQVEVVLMNQIINYQINFRNQLLENLSKEKFIHRLKTIFGVLI